MTCGLLILILMLPSCPSLLPSATPLKIQMQQEVGARLLSLPPRVSNYLTISPLSCKRKIDSNEVAKTVSLNKERKKETEEERNQWPTHNYFAKRVAPS